MQFERIRKNHKRKIIIGGLILVCIISAITITTTRAKYRVAQDISLVRGSINYKPYDFKIMAMYKSEDKTNYTEINEIPGKNYKINESRSYCTLDNINKDGKAKTYTNKYGEHIIESLQKTDKCYLYFDKNTEIVKTIFGNIEVNNYEPDFSQIATEDEGIFRKEDGIYGGLSYYWRGAATTNYLQFGGFCWRIIRINGDGSIRIIYDGKSCHNNGISTMDSIAKANVGYNESYNQSNYVGWTYEETNQRTLFGAPSNAKTQLESWYNSNLASQASKIADGKYCNDRNVGAKYSVWSGTWVATWSISGTPFAYAGVDRLWNKYQPTLSCSLEDLYTLKVGLITADEVELAGGKQEDNASYYLYNGQHYWTMSPFSWNDGSRAVMFYVTNGGCLGYYSVIAGDVGLRPVINLKASTLFVTGGNGTQSNPYVVQ